MTRKVALLFTSAGRRVGLLQSFRSDAQALGIEARILAGDVDRRWSAACHAADQSFAIAPCADAGYAEELLALALRESVDMVIPTIDPELLPLARHHGHFAAAGVDLLVSAPSLVEIARDKWRTADRLRGLGVATPKTAEPAAVAQAPGGWQWPLIAKPRDGSASIGLTLLRSPGDLEHLEPSRSWLVQERLSGPEYTVNVLLDRQGRMVVAVPHERRRVRAGEVEKGITVRDQGLIDAAARICAGLPGGRGALCFQAFKRADGAPVVFEINARFGGGYPLSHAAGAAFGRWLIADRLGLPRPDLSGWRHGLAMLRYDAAVFVAGLDETC